MQAVPCRGGGPADNGRLLGLIKGGACRCAEAVGRAPNEWIPAYTGIGTDEPSKQAQPRQSQAGPCSARNPTVVDNHSHRLQELLSCVTVPLSVAIW